MTQESQSDGTDSGIDRRTVLKSAAAASAAGFVGASFSGGASAATTDSTSGSSATDTTEVTLSWERSAETATRIEKSDVLEGAVSAGWGLTTYSDGKVPGTTGNAVWNEGQYYQGEESKFLDDFNFDFATWEHWDPDGSGAASDEACASGEDSPYDGSNNDDVYQVRKFEATFDLDLLDDVSADDVTGLALTSPVDLNESDAPEDIIPINDNFYVRLNGGSNVETGGTACPNWADDQQAGKYCPAFRNEDYDTNPGMVSSDGWYFDGTLGSEIVNDLEDGTNTIEFVVEEFCKWGGMTRLDLSLTYETCEDCESGTDLLAKYEWEDGEFVTEKSDENIALESVTLDEDDEPQEACFSTDYCNIDAVVKAGTEYKTYEDGSGEVCVTGIEGENSGGETVTYAISNVRFYCEAPGDTSVGESGEEGEEDEEDGEAEDDGEGDHDKGHGNDENGHDEDNPGKGDSEGKGNEDQSDNADNGGGNDDAGDSGNSDNGGGGNGGSGGGGGGGGGGGKGR